MNETLNLDFDFTMRVITPLHIGGMQEKHLVEGLDYVQEKARIFFLDLGKLCESISPQEVSEYLAGIRQGGIGKCLQINRINLSSVASRELSGITVEKEIKAFVKDGLYGKPYIPGSSVKGAIRSIIFGSLNESGKNKVNGKDLEKKLLGNFSSDVFRHIKIGDGAADAITYMNAKVFNLLADQDSNNWKGGWKHELRYGGSRSFNSSGFVFTYECLCPNQSVSLPLRITRPQSAYTNNLKNWSKKETEKGLKGNPLRPSFDQIMTDNPQETLFAIINSKTTAYLDREIQFFQQYPVSETDIIVQELNRIRALIPTDNKYCLFRMSHGSGFHSISGDWQYEDHDKTGLWRGGRHKGKKKYKSRKFIFTQEGRGYHFAPMGFVMWGLSTDLPETGQVVNAAEPVVNITPEAPKPVAVPEFFKGTIKLNSSELDAAVVESGSPNILEVYLTGEETIKLPLINYASPRPTGTIIKVRVTEIDKSTGKPKRISFIKFK